MYIQACITSMETADRQRFAGHVHLASAPSIACTEHVCTNSNYGFVGPVTDTYARHSNHRAADMTCHISRAPALKTHRLGEKKKKKGVRTLCRVASCIGAGDWPDAPPGNLTLSHPPRKDSPLISPPSSIKLSDGLASWC